MKFTKVEPDINFDVLKMVSNGGKWEIGIRLMLFGVRICGNPVGDEAYTFDYCAGDDYVFASVLFAVVIGILKNYPEDVTYQQIQKDFPGWEIRPISKDPYCWKRLQEMANLQMEN